jgi:ribosomal protein L11 methyltransferase
VLEVELGDGRVRLIADVADLDAVAPPDPTWVRSVLVVDDDGYLDAWRTWAVPVRAGRRTVLQPAWVAPEPVGPDDKVVVLDPGRSFGSGSHESTRLAVAALEDHVAAGDRVLDVGCGSGVLAVLAVLLGAPEVVAIDVEPDAVVSTQANAAANGVAERVQASSDPLDAVAGTFDVVVANIGGRALFDLAGELLVRVRPGGCLVLSGVLVDQLDRLVATMAGGVELERWTEDGWGAVALEVGGAISPGARG